MYFFEGGDLSKDSVVLKFERCGHRDDTSTLDGYQEGVKCDLPFVLKNQVRKVPPLGRGIELLDLHLQ